MFQYLHASVKCKRGLYFEHWVLYSFSLERDKLVILSSYALLAYINTGAKYFHAWMLETC